MQKVINVIALLSGLVSLSVVGGTWYLYKNADVMIESVREKAVQEISEAIPEIIEGLMPDIPEIPTTTGGVIPEQKLPTQTGLPIQSFTTP
jgi:hypothetical protein